MFSDPSLNTMLPIEIYKHTISFSALMSNIISYYGIVVPNDAYFKQSLLINSYPIDIPWSQIYASDGSIYGYGYSTSNGSITLSHPDPNGKLFISIYGRETNAGHSYVGGMKLNPINIQRNNELILFITREEAHTNIDGV